MHKVTNVINVYLLKLSFPYTHSVCVCGGGGGGSSTKPFSANIFKFVRAFRNQIRITNEYDQEMHMTRKCYNY